MINLNHIRIRKIKVPLNSLARIALDEKTCKELVWFWKPVQKLLEDLDEQDANCNPRHSNYKEIYLETCLRPAFYSDVRKRFEGNKETVSCNSKFKLSYKQLALLEGLTTAVVFAFVRQHYTNSYEIVEINSGGIIISFSGAFNGTR
jgi:hypothetical protein